MKSKLWALALVLGAGLALGGCGSQPVQEEGPAPVDERPLTGGGDGAPADGGAGGAESSPYRGGPGGALSPLDDPANPLSRRVFYFEFDSFEVSPADYEALTAHARYLAEHPQLEAILEGHADERGSREYNLALGERRAKAVERMLLLQGAADQQLQVISFGEERPVALGHDEGAWRLNRRVELLYSGQ